MLISPPKISFQRYSRSDKVYFLRQGIEFYNHLLFGLVGIVEHGVLLMNRVYVENALWTFG